MGQPKVEWPCKIGLIDEREKRTTNVKLIGVSELAHDECSLWGFFLPCQPFWEDNCPDEFLNCHASLLGHFLYFLVHAVVEGLHELGQVSRHSPGDITGNNRDEIRIQRNPRSPIGETVLKRLVRGVGFQHQFTGTYKHAPRGTE